MSFLFENYQVIIATSAVLSILAYSWSFISTLPSIGALIPKEADSQTDISGYWVARFVHSSSEEKDVVEFYQFSQLRGGRIRVKIDHYSNLAEKKQTYSGDGFLRGNKVCFWWKPSTRTNPELGCIALRIQHRSMEGSYLTWKETEPRGLTGNSTGEPFSFRMKPVRVAFRVRVRKAILGYMFPSYEAVLRSELLSSQESEEIDAEGN